MLAYVTMRPDPQILGDPPPTTWSDHMFSNAWFWLRAALPGSVVLTWSRYVPAARPEAMGHHLLCQ